MQPRPVPFRISSDQVGGAVLVNGEDITDRCAAAHVSVSLDQPTRVVLELRPGAGIIEGLGVVEVATDLDEADVVVRFLASIDPDQLERDALRSHAAGGSLTPKLLEVLAGYARGER